jgi:hypothetical protein
MNVVAECHVAEILRDAGFAGKHIDEIARPSGIDPEKLGASCLFVTAVLTSHQEPCQRASFGFS